jgi:hypothetical protein
VGPPFFNAKRYECLVAFYVIYYACVRDIQQMQFLFFIFDTTGIFISIVRVKTSGRTSLSMLVLLTYTTRKLQYNVDHSFLKRSHQS